MQMITIPGKMIRQITAPNPSAYTQAGTNTYLLGAVELAVIDPGPDDTAHLAAILAACQPGQRITHIFLTHLHLDHSGLARRLSAATDAPIYGYGPYDRGRSATMARLARAGLADGGEGIDRTLVPDVQLEDGQSVTGSGWQITAHHTPGHAANHLCFAWDDVLFSGDHVMGWSTSLISPPDGDAAAYMASLARLATRDWAVALPGHGAPITDVAGRIATLAAHRIGREAAIMAVVQQGPVTLDALTAQVYHDTPTHLHPAARRNLLAHVIDLSDRNRVSCTDLLAPDPIVTLV
jgi:glyoxylase-like metal-dependent hydrolase (beta-lactamase superfamily II)